MQKSTIYDVAKLAKVSVSTVSRVINNYAHVRKVTRDRVLAAMKALREMGVEADFEALFREVDEKMYQDKRRMKQAEEA